MRPVFLFHISVFVFVIGAGAGELDRRLAIVEIAPEVMIKEFAAIIDMEAQNGERQLSFDVSNSLRNGGIAFIPDSACFRPLAENIRQSKAPNEVAFN